MHYESQRKLNELMEKTRHTLRLEDIDDVLELDALAGEITSASDSANSPLDEHAVFVRRVPVYPLTLAHLTLLAELFEHCEDTPDARALCMMWVACIAEVSDEHYDIDATRDAIRKWSRRCRWSSADMKRVLDLRYGAMNSDGNGKSNYGALIGMLCREYGESPEYWMCRAPLGVIESCVNDWNANQEAQAAAHRRASGGRGVAVPPPPSPKFVALRKFRECAERIEQKWLASKA